MILVVDLGALFRFLSVIALQKLEVFISVYIQIIWTLQKYAHDTSKFFFIVNFQVLYRSFVTVELYAILNPFKFPISNHSFPARSLVQLFAALLCTMLPEQLGVRNGIPNTGNMVTLLPLCARSRSSVFVCLKLMFTH